MINQQGSPLHAASCMEDAPASVAGMGHGDGIGISDEPWSEEPDDLDIADLPLALRAMVGGLDSQPSPQLPNNTRSRMKNRLGSKPGAAITPLASGGNRMIRGYGGPQGNIGDLNRRITDLKMESGPAPNRQTSLADLQLRLQPLSEPRRDSNSTVSTYYGSMKSADFGSSRRSSQASGVSAIRPGPIGPGSFYDPISPGNSRRSSQLSNASARMNIPGHVVVNPYSTNNLVVQTQNMSLQVSIGVKIFITSQPHYIMYQWDIFFNACIIIFRVPKQLETNGLCQVIVLQQQQVIVACLNQPEANQIRGFHRPCHLDHALLSYPNFIPTKKLY